MKIPIIALFTAAALMLGVTSVLAEGKGKEITITGKGCCAKCCLKETDKCQNAVTVEKDGKKTTYYLVENSVSSAFHKEICKEIKPVKVTGTCEKKDGRLLVTASKIELAK
ncbi:MAG: hypothetical protein FJ386_07195 [Verrucomicrobia bacterium]|nr:hypothetical protein [Verrucomicrobiota bacterium]